MGQHDVIDDRTMTAVIDGVITVWNPGTEVSERLFNAVVQQTRLLTEDGTVQIQSGAQTYNTGAELGALGGGAGSPQTLELVDWAGFADRTTGEKFLPDNPRMFASSLGVISARDTADRAAAAAAASAASTLRQTQLRNAYFRDENSKLDAQYRRGNEDLDSRGLAARGAYEASSSSANLAELAAKRAHGAEAAALDMKGATGQAAYNQSQLDRTLEGVGLDAADFRVGESVTADPYRALEADQAGVASGQRRYAQDVRAAAVASEEKKILLAEKKVADAKAESDRALGLQMQGIQSSQRNSDRSYGAQIASGKAEAEYRAELLALTEEGNATTAAWQEEQAILQQARWDEEDEAKGLTPVAVAAVAVTPPATTDTNNVPKPKPAWSWSGSKGYAAAGGGGFI